jgi:hypothetical protein
VKEDPAGYRVGVGELGETTPRSQSFERVSIVAQDRAEIKVQSLKTAYVVLRKRECASSTFHLSTSDLQRLTSDFRLPTSDLLYPTSDLRPPPSELTSPFRRCILHSPIADLPGGVRASRTERASLAQTTDADPSNLIWVIPAEGGRLFRRSSHPAGRGWLVCVLCV